MSKDTFAGREFDNQAPGFSNNALEQRAAFQKNRNQTAMNHYQSADAEQKADTSIDAEFRDLRAVIDSLVDQTHALDQRLVRVCKEAPAPDEQQGKVPFAEIGEAHLISLIQYEKHRLYKVLGSVQLLLGRLDI